MYSSVKTLRIIFKATHFNLLRSCEVTEVVLIRYTCDLKAGITQPWQTHEPFVQTTS